MFRTDDTIVAIATPPGRSGVGIVRLSGPAAATIAVRADRPDAAARPRHATFARVETQRPKRSQQPDASSARGPRHRRSGRRHVRSRRRIPTPATTSSRSARTEARSCCSSCCRRQSRRGARLAEPGEFTLRAFLNGKLDLVQAEAVADLIDAVTPLQARAAFDQLDGTLTARSRRSSSALFDLRARLEASLDFPDEGYHFVAIAIQSRRRVARARAKASIACCAAQRAGA